MRRTFAGHSSLILKPEMYHLQMRNTIRPLLSEGTDACGKARKITYFLGRLRSPRFNRVRQLAKLTCACTGSDNAKSLVRRVNKRVTHVADFRKQHVCARARPITLPSRPHLPPHVFKASLKMA